jgi:hypothetical protein
MKKLTINPNKAQTKSLKMLDYEILRDLSKAILRKTDEEFDTMRITDEHVRRFIQRVEFKAVAVTKHSGKEVSSLDQAAEAFDAIGKAVYGGQWISKLISQEIQSSKDENFGIYVANEELTKSLIDELDGVAQVTIEAVNETKKKKTKETKEEKQTESESV